MTDDLKTSEVSASGPDGAHSASAVSVIDRPEMELASAAAHPFIVAEINRLREEIRELKQFKEKYYDLKDKYYGAEKRLAVVKETLKSFRRHRVVSSACLIGGSAGIVAAPNILGLSSYGWYAFISVCAMLLICGMASNVDSTPTDTTTRY